MKEPSQTVDKKPVVLIADSETDIVTQIESILGKNRYSTLKAFNEKDCIALANDNIPDLILLETHNDINGLKICKELKKNKKTKDIHIIFISSKNQVKDKLEGFRMGAVDYITKPFDIKELKARITNHLNVKLFHDDLRKNNEILNEYLRTATLANGYFENITKLVDIDVVMEVTQDYFSKIFEMVEGFSVWLYDDKDEVFKLKVATNKSLLKKVLALQVEDSPIMKTALDKKKIVVFNNFKSSKLYDTSSKSRYKDAKFMCIPLIVESKVLAIANFTSKKDKSDFTVYDQQKAISICQILANKIENCKLYKRIETLSIKDSLTNLYNRQFLDVRLSKEFARVLRTHEPFTIIMADIDHFKKVNDTYGHQEGDSVLKKFANVLASNIREADFAARYGGEEFVIALASTYLKGGLKLAEKLRIAVQKNVTITKKGKKWPITVSLGVACFQNDNYSNAEEMLQAADTALYKAKESGRNRTCYDDKFM